MQLGCGIKAVAKQRPAVFQFSWRQGLQLVLNLLANLQDCNTIRSCYPLKKLSLAVHKFKNMHDFCFACRLAALPTTPAAAAVLALLLLIVPGPVTAQNVRPLAIKHSTKRFQQSGADQ